MTTKKEMDHTQWLCFLMINFLNNSQMKKNLKSESKSLKKSLIMSVNLINMKSKKRKLASNEQKLCCLNNSNNGKRNKKK